MNEQFLYPAVSGQVNTLKQIGVYQDIAKSLSQGIYQLIQGFKMQLNESQDTKVRCSNELRQIQHDMNMIDDKFTL